MPEQEHAMKKTKKTVISSFATGREPASCMVEGLVEMVKGQLGPTMKEIC